MHVPERLLIASGPFTGALSAAEAAAALARGVRAAGRPAPDVLALDCREDDREAVREQLEAAGFEARMRAARAVVLAFARLEERTLAGSAAFEIATRARQAGVPSYAVTAHDLLDAFDARILDLQLVLEARTARSLSAAGGRLAELA
ncbi:MAG TPA: hypothetical protein VL979_06710 [Solirubrobacteraceae bacterium]|nr:hypothetical protein [Solirubrobacteraceae bacterium]